MRRLIDDGLIPDDVTVQVLTQSREHIIRKTFEAVKGAPHAVIHLYNSTSVDFIKNILHLTEHIITIRMLSYINCFVNFTP